MNTDNPVGSARQKAIDDYSNPQLGGTLKERLTRSAAKLQQKQRLESGVMDAPLPVQVSVSAEAVLTVFAAAAELMSELDAFAKLLETIMEDA